MITYFEDLEAGTTYELGSYTAEREELVEFAERYDPQLIHVDPEAARDSIYGGLIASGWHTAGSCMALLVDELLGEVASVGSFGLEELRWRAPVYPGDTVHAAVDLVDTHPSESRDDRGYIDLEVYAENDDGEEVLFWESTNIVLTRAGDESPPADE